MPQRVELHVERIRRGFRTQQAAADAIGVSRATLLAAEGGDGVSLETALKIAAFYGRPVEELFGDVLEEAA